MITFPNAKINLGLNITEKRPDGYHNLETVFYPIPLEDALEVTAGHPEGNAKYTLHQGGIPIEGDPDTNLVVKAYRMLDERFNLPPVDIHLFKHIPSGAGLGGGSADAAFMLKMLNEEFRLKLTDDELEAYAARLVLTALSSSAIVPPTPKASETSFHPSAFRSTAIACW